MPKYTEKQLQDAISHARQEPEVPTRRIAELHNVNYTTLRRRILGIQQERHIAHRDEQLFTSGEERAIANYVGMMADSGFPVSQELLQRIAQDIVNSRQMEQRGQGGGITTGPHRECRLQQQGAILPPIGASATVSATTSSSATTSKSTTTSAITSKSTTTSAITSKSTTTSTTILPAPIHVIGSHWVDRFLARNSQFHKRFIRYQERARQAASNDIESQAYFLCLLANLIRCKNIVPEDLWNCDEKGITMGRSNTRTMAIVRRGIRATALTEGSREFCSVLETISAMGVVLPPFIVWQGKSHRESYYNQGGIELEATFAMSPSGYMDDELGLEFMKHFERYSARDSLPHLRPRPRCLIVDGHSSHIAWRVVKYALDHGIHMICLPSKSTHLLQPLDVGCFGPLQLTYARELSIWLQNNPLSVVNKVVFLEILQKTREKVYTVQTIQNAWKSARCWPIDPPRPLQLEVPTAEFSNKISDTPALLRDLSRQVEALLHDLDTIRKNLLLDYIDIAAEKVTKYRDIAPRAITLNKLRNGKVRQQKKRTRHVGSARVLTYKMVNDALKTLEEANTQKLARQQAYAEKKRLAEEKKLAITALEKQWQVDLENYKALIAEWEKMCAEHDATWIASKSSSTGQRGQRGRKPPYPPKPKRPLKPKYHVIEEELGEAAAEQPEEQDLVDAMRSLEIERWSEVCSPCDSTILVDSAILAILT